MIPQLALGLTLVVAPMATAASDLVLPASARQLTDRVNQLDSYDLPTGDFGAKGVPARRIEGQVQRRSWRIDGGAITTLQVLRPLRDQIVAAGYDIVFECEDRACGGFDFRFETEVIPAPDMHVDIRNYRFLSAVHESDAALSVLVSRSRSAAYIQIIRVSPLNGVVGEVKPQPPEQPVLAGPGVNGLAADLVLQGHVVLGGLEFEFGAASLSNGPYASLRALASFLESAPDQRIALVGHTDSAGALGTNISLSKRRAASIKQRLVDTYGVDPRRIDAEGMGYLAPVASNLTVEGRDANRRVEAILLPEN